MTQRPVAPTVGNGADGTEVIQRSVTRRDFNEQATAGAIYHFMIPALGSASAPDLPAYWTPARDYQLYSTLYRESMWQAALSIAISKIVAMGFDVDSEIPLRAKRAQALFLNFDGGRGYVSGLQKHLQSFLLTCNGAHVEIVRASPALGSRIIGLVPLDSFRCWRTGDPDIPIIYRDRMGGEHELRDYDVISLADMPDQADTWYGLGHPAAERAYKTICKLEGIEKYILEKVTGQRALSLYFVNGVMPSNIADALNTARGEAQAKGFSTYMGAAIAGMMGDVPLSVVEIPLAELPDGFQRKEEWDIALTTYARCLGIAVQDLQPLSGQGLGTGTQSVVLDEAAKGQGLAGWRQAFEHACNEYVLDDKTTFAIRTYDIRDKEREAKVRIDEATAMQLWTMIGLSAAQAINLGVDRDQLPPEYRIEGDLTPGETLSDEEKPAQVAVDEQAADANADAQQTQGQAPAGQPGQQAPAPTAGRTPQAIVQKAMRLIEFPDGTEAEMVATLKEIAAALGQPESTVERIDAETLAALRRLAGDVGALRDEFAHFKQAAGPEAPVSFTVLGRDGQGRVLEFHNGREICRVTARDGAGRMLAYEVVEAVADA